MHKEVCVADRKQTVEEFHTCAQGGFVLQIETDSRGVSHMCTRRVCFAEEGLFCRSKTGVSHMWSFTHVHKEVCFADRNRDSRGGFVLQIGTDSRVSSLFLKSTFLYSSFANDYVN